MATLRNDLVARGLRDPKLLGALRDPVTITLIQRASPGLTVAEAEYLQIGLEGEVAGMHVALERARAHLGKDEGVYAVDDRTLVVELRGVHGVVPEEHGVAAGMPAARDDRRHLRIDRRCWSKRVGGLERCVRGLPLDPQTAAEA